MGVSVPELAETRYLLEKNSIVEVFDRLASFRNFRVSGSARRKERIKLDSPDASREKNARCLRKQLRVSIR